MNTVTPKTFLVGSTEIDLEGIEDYLKHTKQLDFMECFSERIADSQYTTERRMKGLAAGGEVLCSVYAKLCYKALTVGKNENIEKVRDIPDNIAATLKAGHGSVFEHVWLNFITTDCSRVFTHELVRHRVGTAFSQTSGRYVRSDHLDMVLDDPILNQPLKDGTNLRDVFGKAAGDIEAYYRATDNLIDWDSLDFTTKKKLTSALRRILPNGQANEIGWSANIRTLRHLLMLRTARFAEWEIRSVFAEVYQICKEKFPLLFADAKVEIVDGLPEITGMVTQPY